MSGFVGRGRELAVLGAELARAADSALRAVLLVSEPGIGKTRLAAELPARHAGDVVGLSAPGLSARRHSFTRLVGRCARRAFRDLLRADLAAELAAALGRQRDGGWAAGPFARFIAADLAEIAGRTCDEAALGPLDDHLGEALRGAASPCQRNRPAERPR